MSAPRAERVRAAVDPHLAEHIGVGDSVLVHTRTERYVGRVECKISVSGKPYTLICRVPPRHTHVKWENTLAFGVLTQSELTSNVKAVIVGFQPQEVSHE
jgi:hypothetical protein